MSIRTPQAFSRQVKAMNNWGEMNRWATNVNDTLSDSVQSLNDMAIHLRRILNTTQQSIVLTPHGTSHLPNGSDPLATAAPTFTFGTAAATGSANSLVRSDATLAIFDATVPAALASAAAAGSAGVAARRDHVHLWPSTLRSTSATAGDTLTLTSDGANLTLTPSRASADLIFADQAGATVARLFDTSGTNRGLWVNGHLAVGQTPSSPGAGSLIFSAESLSQSSATTFALNFTLILDGTPVGTTTGSLITLTLAEGYTGANTLTGQALTLNDDGAIVTNPVAVPALVGQSITVNPITPGGPAFTSATGLNIAAVSAFNGAAQVTTATGIDIQGVVGNTTAYGLRVRTVTGTNAFAASLAGMTQITGTNKLGLGRPQGTLPTNSFHAKTSTGTIVVLELNSGDVYEFDTTAFYPTTNGAVSVGKNGNGFASLWLKDTAAAFETTIQATNTGIAADNVLTLDLGNASRTLTLSGNPTIADWFDQSVKQAASPTFAGLTVNAFAFTVNGAPTLNNWFDQNVKTTGTPQFARAGIGQAADGTVILAVNDATTAPSTSAVAAVTNKYGGDTNYCGDPNAWLRLRVGASTYKVPLYT